MEISRYLTESAVLMDLDGSDKSEIIGILVDSFTGNAKVNNSSAVLNRLLEREKLKTTGIGSGVAIPHCRIASVDRVHVVVGLSRKGLDFQSLDDQPVHLFFLIVAPEKDGAQHLKTCAKIARLVKDANFRDNLLQFQTAAEVVEFIKEREITLR